MLCTEPLGREMSPPKGGGQYQQRANWGRSRAKCPISHISHCMLAYGVFPCTVISHLNAALEGLFWDLSFILREPVGPGSSISIQFPRRFQ